MVSGPTIWDMAEVKAPYKHSGATLIVIGAVATVGGIVCWVYLWGSVVGALGFFVGLGGLVLFIIGAIRQTAVKPVRPANQDAFDAWVKKEEAELRAPSPYDDSK